MVTIITNDIQKQLAEISLFDTEEGNREDRFYCYDISRCHPLFFYDTFWYAE